MQLTVQELNEVIEGLSYVAGVAEGRRQQMKLLREKVLTTEQTTDEQKTDEQRGAGNGVSSHETVDG